MAQLLRLSWRGTGAGVYAKIGVAQDGVSMLYLGSASRFFCRTAEGMMSLQKRRREHEKVVEADELLEADRSVSSHSEYALNFACS